MRQLSAATKAALRRSHRIVAVFVRIGHPSGEGRFWSGLGPIEWGGHTWIGAGHIGSIDPVESSSAIEINEIRYTMTKLPPDVVAQLSREIKGYTASLWLGFLTIEGTLVDDPILILDSDLDYQSFAIAEDGSASLQVVSQHGFWRVEEPSDIKWSPEEHKLVHPGDAGLDLLPSLVNKVVAWTRS